MVALSIKLPDTLAEASRVTARKLGITRSEFIRQALAHEIEQVEAGLERRALADSLANMGRNMPASSEAEQLDQAMDEGLPQERENWWNG
jgi:predicted transcriptional regulator